MQTFRRDPSNVVLQRAQSLGRANPVLKEETQPLDSGAVGHELGKLGHIGAGHLPDARVARGRVDVAADGPATSRGLVLLGQDERVQQLSALGMGSILENGTGLGPRDEVARGGREREVEGRRGRQANGSGEGCNVGAVGAGDEGRGRASTADPARLLGEQLLKPLVALLLHDEVEGEEHRIVVVGVRQNQLVLELGTQVVVELLGSIRDVVGVPHVGPVEDVEAVVVAVSVAEVLVDGLPAQRLVRQQSALRLPARVVVQRLKRNAVDVHIASCDLAVNLSRC